ncbi:hypothetical protein LL06_11215 [Hoeflea sp. BAL378]|nr:hypothetical protein LL06_11215 [Hoeflea sp. BAL378]
MLNLKAMIETHEDWLTDRVVHYAQQKSLTEYSSTLREAWRISICKLSEPLMRLIEATESSLISQETALREADEFGRSQGIKHRSLGIEGRDFVGMLKLYRKAYVDFFTEMRLPDVQRDVLQPLILELFDAIELGVLTAYTASSTTDQMDRLQKSNRELSNEKNKYLTVFESIAEPAILLDTDAKPTHVNASAIRLLLGEMQPGAGYYGDLDNPVLHDLVAEILQSGSHAQSRVTLDTPGGKRVFNVAIQQMLDISRKFSGQVIILQDVTAYLQAIEAAQTADRAKSVFLTTISHEIRTPINSILGLTGLLEEEALLAPKLPQLRSIRAAGEMLSALIENVLGLSKAETNAFQLLEQDFNLTVLCEALFRVLELGDGDQRRTLEMRFAPDVPLQLHGDGPKLRHILLNLLSNALKFTERGSVALVVTKEQSGTHDRPALRFEVIDTGPGVRRDEVDRLFEPFVQGTHATSVSALRGSGLGLAISKRLVEFLGGEISYRPNPKGGSIFGFSLQFSLAKQPSLQPQDSALLSILVVEDDPVNAMVIEGYIRELGHSVTVVGSYAEAVDALGRTVFDVVVTDYRLGVKTGLDVAHVVHLTGQRMGVQIPVIVVTAAMPPDASNSLKQPDVRLFLEKPFSRSELASALTSVTHAIDRQGEARPEKTTAYISASDLNRLLSDIGFDRCRAVVRSYQSNMPNLVSRMQKHLENGKLFDVSELAHQLISASSFVGAWPLVEQVKAVKTLCKTAEPEAVQDVFAEFLLVSRLTEQELETRWSQMEKVHIG